MWRIESVEEEEAGTQKKHLRTDNETAIVGSYGVREPINEICSRGSATLL